MKTLHLAIIAIIAVIFFATNYTSAQTSQYNFKIWPAESWKAPGFWETIQGKMCPTPVPDPNTSVSTKVYFGLPSWAAQQANTSQFVRESNELPSCDKIINVTTIRPNFTGIYPVYVISKWTQNGIPQTVQSNNTQFLAIEVCPSSYVMNVDKLRYHPGDIVPIKIESPSLDCMHLPTNIGITVYNSTDDGITQNILYQKSMQIVNQTLFNYAVPNQTDSDGLLHFLIRLTWAEPNGVVGKQDFQFLSTDINKSMRSYNSGNLTTWADPSSTVNGSNTEIISKICPFAPATDEGREEKKDPITGLITDSGSFILLNYHITLPNGSQKLVQGELVPYDDCSKTWDEQVIDANMIGVWSSSVTAQWMENGIMHTLDAAPVHFEVRTPIFQSNNVEEMNITNIVKISHVPPGEKPRFDVMDWSRDGRFLLFNYVDYQNPTSNPQFAVMNLSNNQVTQVNLPQNTSETSWLSDAKISLNGNSFYFVLDGNLYLYNLGNKTFHQLTDSGGIVKIQVLHNGDLVYSQKQSEQNSTNNINYDIWQAYPNGTKIDDLLQSQNVGSFNLSPDGKKLVMIVDKGGGCEYCAYTEAQVVDLNTKQETTIPRISNAVEGKWSPTGDLIVWHSNAGYKAPGGALTLTDQSGGFQEELFSGHDNPTSFVISSDGSSIIYGLDYWSCCAQAAGLYKLHLAKAIPEFPYEIPILLVSIVSLIVFYNMKFRK